MSTWKALMVKLLKVPANIASFEESVGRWCWASIQRPIPENWEIVNPTKILPKITQYHSIAFDIRIINNDTWHMFFFSDSCGYAFSLHNQWAIFGCHHTFKLIKNLGRCYNRYQCTNPNCGWIKDVDSSD